MNPAQKAIKLLDQFQKRLPGLSFLVGVWKLFSDDQAGNLAALIAYYAFVSIFPLLLILFTVLNIVLRDNQSLQDRVISSTSPTNSCTASRSTGRRSASCWA